MDFPEILTHWYSENKRDFPFRKTKDPYTIWISEVIFQQTRIEQGMSYFQRFMERFPNVESLAQAEEDEVLKNWEGLGYYSRARNLHFSAQYIMNELGGKFPAKYDDIIKLKGVGDYTAGAISSICFNEPRLAIDGNALRVYSRIFNSFLNIADPATSKHFKNLITPLIPKNSGDFNQAVMELGATICTPKNPDCDNCPVSEKCLAFKNNTQKDLPIKEKKLKVQNRSLEYYLYHNERGLLIQQRKKPGIWKGLYELVPERLNEFDFKKEKNVKHKLTHQNLDIQFYSQIVENSDLEGFGQGENAKWIDWNEVENLAFPKPIKDFIFTFVRINKSGKNL